MLDDFQTLLLYVMDLTTPVGALNSSLEIQL